MIQQIEELYTNNALKLHNMVDSIVNKYGGFSNKDRDDFYSVANTTITEILNDNRYDPSQGEFLAYVRSAISNAIKDEVSYKNAQKRNAYEKDKNGRLIKDENGKPIIIPTLSIDSPMGEDNTSTIGDFLCDETFDLEDIVEKRNGVIWSENVEKYLNSLTKVQRDIIMLRMNDKTVDQIRDILGLTRKEFEQQLSAMKNFEHVNLLYGKQAQQSDTREEKRMNTCMPQTLEKSKTMQLSIASIVSKMDKQTLRYDHPLQRCSEMWSPTMKGNLISDILQNNPIPQLVFAEQVFNGIAIIWNLDGKQRSTNAYSFVKGQYKVSKNIRRWDIEYQAQLRDENGERVFDDMGIPVCEKRTFDIRGKKFTDLPEELRERFMDYTFEIVQYINCSAEDIAYHIARYNEGKPATASQKGIIRLGETFATMVKSICNMPFFKDMGGYKVSEFKNGVINRVVVESVMAANYLEDWKPKLDDMCQYMRDNASSEDFDNFEDMVHRLESVVTDEVGDMFNSKDSFLWFGLFARFVDTGLEDEKFVEFMAEFAQSLHSKETDGASFDDLNGKSTKDKSVVLGKMEHLEKLMNTYLGVSTCGDRAVGLNLDSDWTEFVDTFSKSKVFLMMDVAPTTMKEIAVQSVMLMDNKTDLSDAVMQDYVDTYCVNEQNVEDIKLYMDMLDDYSVNLNAIYYNIRPETIPTLVGVMKYVWDNEINSDKLIVTLLEKWVNDLSVDAKGKVNDYLLMVDDLKNDRVEVA